MYVKKLEMSRRDVDEIDVEDELAKNEEFIAANEAQLPVFATAEEAMAKLAKLKVKLKRIKAENAKVARQRPDIDARLSAITEQNRSLAGEDERIEKLREINEQAKEREFAEYEEVQRSIARAREALATLQTEAKQVRRATEEAKRAVERVNTEFLAKKAMLDRMRAEEEELAELEEKSRAEISAHEQEQVTREREEEAVKNAEADLEAKEAQLKKYKQILIEKQQLVSQKRENIRKIMADNDSIGKKLDAEVTRAEETIKAVADDSDESSGLEVAFPAQVSTKRKSVNPFSMFRRTQQLDSSSDDSHHGMSQKTLELLSDGSEDEIPLKMPSASPISMSTQKRSENLSDDSMSDSEANERFAELMKRTERNVSPVKELSAQLSPKAQTEISIDAINALEMPLVDTSPLRARIEAQTSGWRNRSAF